MNDWLETHLIREENKRYVLHDSVRQTCSTEQEKQQKNWPGLHRHIASIRRCEGDILAAAKHYIKAGDFSKAIQLLADNTIEVIRKGKAQTAGDLIEELWNKQDSLDKQGILWVCVLRGDLYYWLGQIDDARFITQHGFNCVAGLPTREDLEVQYLEGRLRLRLGVILRDRDHLIQSEKLMRNYVEAQGPRCDASRAHEWLKALYNLGIMDWLRGLELDGEERTLAFDQAIHWYKECIKNTVFLNQAYKNVHSGHAGYEECIKEHELPKTRPAQENLGRLWFSWAGTSV